VILVDQTAESIDADDYAITPAPRGARVRRFERQPTMRSSLVAVPEMLPDDPLQMALPKVIEGQRLPPSCRQDASPRPYTPHHGPAPSPHRNRKRSVGLPKDTEEETAEGT